MCWAFLVRRIAPYVIWGHGVVCIGCHLVGSVVCVSPLRGLGRERGVGVRGFTPPAIVVPPLWGLGLVVVGLLARTIRGLLGIGDSLRVRRQVVLGDDICGVCVVAIPALALRAFFCFIPISWVVGVFWCEGSHATCLGARSVVLVFGF